MLLNVLEKLQSLKTKRISEGRKVNKLTKGVARILEAAYDTKNISKNVTNKIRTNSERKGKK